jgi:hypothetical protein
MTASPLPAARAQLPDLRQKLARLIAPEQAALIRRIDRGTSTLEEVQALLAPIKEAERRVLWVLDHEPEIRDAAPRIKAARAGRTARDADDTAHTMLLELIRRRAELYDLSVRKRNLKAEMRDVKVSELLSLAKASAWYANHAPEIAALSAWFAIARGARPGAPPPDLPVPAPRAPLPPLPYTAADLEDADERTWITDDPLPMTAPSAEERAAIEAHPAVAAVRSTFPEAHVAAQRRMGAA